MSLTPEQKQIVAAWVAAGDNLSLVQKKLSEQFKISMTYRDVRFLVDDLNLELIDPAPKADASDVSKAQVTQPTGGGVPSPRAASGPKVAKPGLAENPQDSGGHVGGHDDEDEISGGENYPAEDENPLPESAPAGGSTLTLELDRIMRPGAMVSGNVTFSDGVTGKWALDQQGRLMLDTSQKGYQPTPTDVQAFQRELQTQLQRQGY